MTRGGRRLTTRAWVVLGAAAGLALAGELFGIMEMYPIAVAAVMLVLAARVWVGLRQWRLEVSRRVHPVRVPAGQEARVDLTVVNRGWTTTPVIHASDPFDGGRRWARFAIAPLAPDAHRRASYRLPTTRRGVYHLGPLELKVTDPFGLAQTWRTTAPDTALTVHPRVEPVAVRWPSSHRDEDRVPQPVLGKGGDEFYALREYVPGDDLRHVHWASTARLDELVIRQPENLRRGRVTVVADLRASVHDADSLEAVLSAVASVAMSWLRARMQVRVVTTAGFDTGHGSGRNRAQTILDGLAAAEAHRVSRLEQPFRMVGTLDPVVLVTTDRAGDADYESAFGLGGPTGTTVVVFETAPSRSESRDDRQGADGLGTNGLGTDWLGTDWLRAVGMGGHGAIRMGGHGAIRVPKGGSFRKAWDAATC